LGDQAMMVRRAIGDPVMPASPADDPVLRRFRATLEDIYGDRLERVVLFGSRARGEARADSDYDIAVFLRGFHDRWREVDRIVPVVTDIIDDTGAVIHAMPYRAGAYQDRTSLMREIRREGVDL
jgi:predicted nucleotidyltransferase